jgi:hypothetical protein
VVPVRERPGRAASGGTSACRRQVAELLAAVRAQRRFGPFAALASQPFSGQEGIRRLGRFFLQLILISRREDELYGFKE